MSMVGENWKVKLSDNSETDIHIIKENDEYVEVLQVKNGFVICGCPSRFGKSSTEFVERIG